MGARARWVYHHPQTPLGRVLASREADPGKTAHLQALRGRLDPFAQAQAMDQKLERLYAMAHHHTAAKRTGKAAELTPTGKQAIHVLHPRLGTPITVGIQAQRVQEEVNISNGAIIPLRRPGPRSADPARGSQR